MKKLLLIGLLALLSISLVQAFSAHKVACQNQDGFDHCVPGDTTCVYISKGVAVTAVLSDSDGDGWDNYCDAFINDPTEQMDFDGDGVGHNDDCNDFDDQIGACVKADSESSEEEESSSSSSTKSRSLSGGTQCIQTEWECTKWSECSGGVEKRTCTRDNSICNTDSNKPAEERTCGESGSGFVELASGTPTSVDSDITEVVEIVEDSEETEPVQVEAQEDSSLLTSLVFTLGILFTALALLFLFWNRS